MTELVSLKSVLTKELLLTNQLKKLLTLQTQSFFKAQV